MTVRAILSITLEGKGICVMNEVLRSQIVSEPEGLDVLTSGRDLLLLRDLKSPGFLKLQSIGNTEVIFMERSIESSDLPAACIVQLGVGDRENGYEVVWEVQGTNTVQNITYNAKKASFTIEFSDRTKKTISLAEKITPSDPNSLARASLSGTLKTLAL